MYSKNGIALVVLVAEAVLTSLQIEFDPGTIEKAVEGLLVTAALIAAIINQYKRKDTKAFILKTTPEIPSGVPTLRDTRAGSRR